MTDIPRRVHIAPQGFEDERIYRPAIEREADIVILIGHNEPDDTAERCRERIVDVLKEHRITVQDDVTCDLFELADALETILAVIRDRNPDDIIRVNISAGSKITAIAGMLACMFTAADPYYVVPEGYNESAEGSEYETVSHGMNDIKPLPAYPVTEPDLQLIEVLSFIQEEQPESGPDGVILRDIGQYLLEHDLPVVQASDKKPEEVDDIYPMINEIVDPLMQRGFVSKKRFDGGTHVRTTSEGEEMLSLAKSLNSR
ncbi:DUF6293 family protein [Halobellus ordinarius]|uniref:HFX_2341 family transcriptional regulator domain-containing protein n=1 Tax=Halobellus ordinarius TaxID=3075120 RepID=UPI0028801A16|nr:DUF6293 family protein [Halobellus sp. ZY16]